MSAFRVAFCALAVLCFIQVSTGCCCCKKCDLSFCCPLFQFDCKPCCNPCCKPPMPIAVPRPPVIAAPVATCVQDCYPELSYGCGPCVDDCYLGGGCLGGGCLGGGCLGRGYLGGDCFGSCCCKKPKCCKKKKCCCGCCGCC